MVRISSLRCWWITAQSHEQPRIGRWRLTAVRSARDSGDREQRVGCRLAFMLDIHGGRELRDVAACPGWQRNALPDVCGIAGRAGVVGGERAGHAEAVYHLAQTGSAGDDGVARGEGMEAKAGPRPERQSAERREGQED